MQAKTGNKDWVRMKGKDRLGLYEGEQKDWVPMQSARILIGFLCRNEFYYLELLGIHMMGFICRMIGFLCRKQTKSPVESGLPFGQPA